MIVEDKKSGVVFFVCTVDEISNSYKGGKGEAGRNLRLLIDYLMKLAES
jgi:hypothetical protein